VENVIHMLIDQGMKEAKIMISGLGPRRDTTLRAIQKSGVILNFVSGVTPMPHNGCRPPKKNLYKDEIYCKELLLNMIWNEEVLIFARILQWRCVESRVYVFIMVDSPYLHSELVKPR
jgi:hypothetical protein